MESNRSQRLRHPRVGWAERVFMNTERLMDEAGNALARLPVLGRVVERLYWPVRELIRVTLSPQDIILNTEFGEFVVSPGSSLGRQLYYYGHKPSEADFEALLTEITYDEMTFVDVGAHIGYFSVRVGRIVDCEVVAVEPSEENLRYLRENCRRNDINSKIVEKVVSDSRGTSQFWDVGKNDQLNMLGVEETKWASTVKSVWRDYPAKRVERGVDNLNVKAVETTTVPDIANTLDIDSVTLLKVDVEGAEGRVLEGLQGDWDLVDCIVVELHEEFMRNYDETSDDVIALLRDAGYELYHLDNRGGFDILSDGDEATQFAMDMQSLHMLVGAMPSTKIHQKLERAFDRW